MAARRWGQEEERERRREATSTTTAAPSLARLDDQAAFRSSLARSDTAARAGAMHALQAGVGNAAVGRMLASKADPHRCGPGCGHDRVATSASNESRSRQAGPGTQVAGGSIVKTAPFAVKLRMGPTSLPEAPQAVAASTLDSKVKKEPTKPEDIKLEEDAPAKVAGEKPAPQGEAKAPEGAPAESEKISIPEVRSPETEMAHCCDAVQGLMMYEANIQRGTNVPADAFGICRFGDVRLKEISIEKMFDWFVVLGIVENRIKWEVHSLGNTDISGPDDADLKQSNYGDVVKDLTPDLSSSGGRPKRDQYWAKDLTERHELFHAKDVEGQGQGATSAAVKWLEGATISTMKEAKLMVNLLPKRIVQTLAAGMGEPAEVRAYGDGVPAYQARVDAIQLKGDMEEYKQ
jgi:hypothetical protein